MATAPAVQIVIKSSATLVPGSDTSAPPRPYRRLADVGPNGLPADFPEDTQNQRYATLQVPRQGEATEEQWNIKMEYSKLANQTLQIMNWAHNKILAGRMLEDGVDAHIAQLGTSKSKTITRDASFNAVTSTYKSNNSFEDVWFWWDVIEVPLRPLKSYGVQDPIWEQDRVKDLEARERDALDMVRRSRRGFTEEERKEAARRKARLGIVEGEDLEDVLVTPTI